MTEDENGRPARTADPHISHLESTGRIVIPQVADYDPANPDGVRNAAMALARTLYVVPLADYGVSQCKNPGTLLGTDWPSRSVTGAADAYAMFAEDFPQACGVGIHVGKSGLLEIDIDTEDRRIVPPEILLAIQECDPPNWTTRKGADLQAHYAFQQPPGRMIGNSGALKGPTGEKWGDVRGKNGIVVAPGSRHAREDGLYHLRKAGVAPILPAYLADLLPDASGEKTVGTDGSVAWSSGVDGLTDAEVLAFLAEHRSEIKPQALKGILSKFAALAPGGRHTAAVEVACWAMREARAGLYPAQRAADELREALSQVAGQERDTGREFAGILSYAAAAAVGAPEERMIEIRAKAFGDLPTVTDEAGVERLHPHPIVLPSPGAPARVGRVLAAKMPTTDGCSTTKWWQDDFYAWEGTRWDVLPAAVLEKWLYEQTEHAEYWAPPKGVVAEMVNGEIVPAEVQEEDGEYRRWNPTIKKIQEVTNAMAKLIFQHVGEEEPALACGNGVVDLQTRELLPHTPRRFNLNSLPFDYSQDAECPRWIQFLDECLPGDAEAHAFLGEWFGYVLSGRTDQQKIASLIGKRRGGKGTIARTLTSMLGKGNWTSPDITELGSHFGRASLIGKSLAVMGDVRWNSNLSSEALKTFLAVSGEDGVTIPRKHKDDWTGRLPLRFMVLSNDVPTFADRSNAIGSRMIHVKFDVTFEGREDSSLEGKLLDEQPGILNWALDGLHRLSDRGRFTVPTSGLVISQQMEEDSNPVALFLEEECEAAQGVETPSVVLLGAYGVWAERRGMKRPDVRTLNTELRRQGFAIERKRAGGPQKEQVVIGLKCLTNNVFQTFAAK